MMGRQATPGLPELGVSMPREWWEFAGGKYDWLALTLEERCRLMLMVRGLMAGLVTGLEVEFGG